MTSDPPVVSVVLPTHDRAEFLPRAVDSVLGQTFDSLELIIVDDASTDRTPDVIAACGDSRIRSFRHDVNRGGAAARNTAIRAARGEYVAFLDSDDEWLPRKLELQVSRLAGADGRIGVVYSRSAIYDVDRQVVRPQAVELVQGDVYDQLLAGWCPTITSTVLARRSALTAVGGFDESLASFHDFDLWIRLARDHRFLGMDRTLTIRHEHGATQLSRDSRARRKALQDFLDKWSSEIETRLGTEVVQFIRRRHLGSILWHATIDRLRRSDRAGAWRYFFRYLREGPTVPSWKHCVEFAAGQLGGAGLHSALTSGWRRLTWTRCPAGDVAAVLGQDEPDGS